MTAPKPEPDSSHLLRLLGVSFGVAVTVGGTIGVGILRTPGLVAAQLPYLWAILAVWILGGIYAILGTISVVELGTMLPRAGGWYVYARRAFGDFGGFTVGWIDWVAQSSALAYLATATGEFAVALVPAMPGGVRAFGVGVLVAFALLHRLGLRSGSKAQELTSLVKGLALIAFVILCFVYGGRSEAPVAAIPMPTSALAAVVAVIIALQSIIITHDGWYCAVYFTEEDRDPGRNLPRSAIGGVVAIIVIYLLVNLALLYTLPIPELAGSVLPAADAAQRIFGGHGGQIITALSLVSLLSVINATLLIATRVLFAMSRDHLFFKKASEVHPRGTPLLAMWLTTGASVLLVVSGSFETLVAIAAVFFVLCYLSGFVSLFVLRKREPNLERPFRVWGYPWTPGIAAVGSVLFLIGNLFSDTRNSLYAFALIAASYPVFLTMTRRKDA